MGQPGVGVGVKKGAEEVLAKVKGRKWSVPGWGGDGCVLGISRDLNQAIQVQIVNREEFSMTQESLLQVLLVGTQTAN